MWRLHLLCKRPKVFMIPWIFQKSNSFLKYMCFGSSKEPSHETVLLSTHNKCFWLRNNKIIFHYIFLSGGLTLSCWEEVWMLCVVCWFFLKSTFSKIPFRNTNIQMHMQMQRDILLDNVINLRQYILLYTVANPTSLCNVAFHWLTSGLMKLAATGCTGATKYIFAVYLKGKC